MSYPIGSVRQDRSSTILRALHWLAIIVATAWLFWGVILPASNQQSPGFAAAYTAARLILVHEFGPEVYDPASFQIMERRLGLDDGSYGIQPPPMALLLTPVAWMQPSVAHMVWLILDVVWLVGIGAVTMAIAYRAGAPMSLASLAITVIVLAIYRPLHIDLADAQVNTLLALIAAIWLYGYTREHDWLCGLGLAFLSLVHPTGGLFWLVLLASRRRKTLAWGGGLTLIGFLLTLPLVGLASWRVYLVNGITSLLAWLPQHWLSFILWLVTIGLICWLTFIHTQPELRLLMGSATLCMAAPLQLASEPYSDVIMMIPLLLLLLLVAPRPQEAPVAFALGGLALAFLSVSIDILVIPNWPRWDLLIPPRLYGALSVCAALISLRRTDLTFMISQRDPSR